MEATYTSVFDDVDSVTTPCKYDPRTKRVFDIRDVGDGVVILTDANSLTDEFVTLPDGTELREADGVKFDY
jgi:hypothetical protein